MEKLLAKMAHKAAEKEANKGCPWWFYCSELPQKVKNLKK